ncbi:PAN domain protein [Trichinella nativa]|uniref:PAN domain protein n=1 Tax=Trichinella nativa TaxID=6335 RepID=A0A1Y3EDH3_9BILA|nr:PAN domain protein [Trichinella nativa]
MICKAVALFLYIFYGWFNLCAHSARRVDEFTVIIPETSETCNVELKYGVGYSYRQLDEEYGIYSLSACVHLCKRKYFNCAAVDFDRQRNVCISLKRATDDTTPYMRSSGDFAVITYCSKGTRSEMFGRRTTDFDFYNSDTTTPSYSNYGRLRSRTTNFDLYDSYTTTPSYYGACPDGENSFKTCLSSSSCPDGYYCKDGNCCRDKGSGKGRCPFIKPRNFSNSKFCLSDTDCVLSFLQKFEANCSSKILYRIFEKPVLDF